MIVPTVEFDNGIVTTVGPVDYPYKVPNTDSVIVRNQVPLKLAWATTIHKSQGSTLTSAELILGKAFNYGQIYVALSRVRDIKGLWIADNVENLKVRASPEVLSFYGYSRRRNSNNFI